MMSDGDELFAATAAEVDRETRSECERLQRQLLALEQEHRKLQVTHQSLQADCGDRLETLKWIVSLDNASGPERDARRTVTLTQIIDRVRNTLGRSEEV